MEGCFENIKINEIKLNNNKISQIQLFKLNFSSTNNML